MGRQSMPVRHNSRNWLRRSLYGLADRILGRCSSPPVYSSLVETPTALQTAVDRRTKRL